MAKAESVATKRQTPTEKYLNAIGEVTINKATVESIVKKIKQESEQTIKEGMEVTWEQLQTAAKEFLQGYKILQEAGKNFKSQLINALNQITPKNAPQKTKALEQERLQILRGQYLLAIEFEKYLNAYRKNAPSSMAYIYEDPDGSLTVYELSLREMVMGSSLDKDSLRFSSINYLKKLQSTEEGKIKKYFKEKEEHMIEAQNVYQWTEARFYRHFEVFQRSQKNMAILMWKENREWVLNTLLNLGDVKEGFTNFLISNHINELCQKIKNADNNLDKYGDHDAVKTFYENYITQVTNLDAIVEEDILIKDSEGKVEFQIGVKSGKAALPGITQYLKMAYNILKNDDLKDNINEWIKNNFNEGDHRNKTIDSLEKAAGKATQEVLNEMLYDKRRKMNIRGFGQNRLKQNP